MIKCRAAFLIMSASLVSRAVIASPGDDHLRRLLTARSAAQFSRLLNDTHKQRRMQLVCEAQLRSQRIPVSCFEAMGDLDEWGVSNPRAEPDDRIWLDDLCVTRANASNDWRELRAAARSLRLPVKCKNAIARREGDLRYTDQVDRPIEIFQRRFAEPTAK